MKGLPVGRQNFKGIIEENLLYVDKTRQMYEIIRNGNLFFLSRPRRFGKSLLVSKFKYLFSGKKDLFKGLYRDIVVWARLVRHFDSSKFCFLRFLCKKTVANQNPGEGRAG